MAAFTLGEAAAMALAPMTAGLLPGRVRAPARSGALHRSGQPVRRGSVEEGSFEHLFFAAPAKGEGDRLLRAARSALDAGRRAKRAARAEGRDLTGPERALAGVTAAAVRVYEELLTLARLNRGRVYPGYDRLAEVTALGRATVARAISALEAAGFLVRQRRYRRVEGEGAGPRYAQASNAYRPTWPAALAEWLPRRFRPALTPPCALQHAAEQAEATEAMRATLSCRELAETMVSGALGRMLARLGASVDRRESHKSPETLLQSYRRDFSSIDLDGRYVPPDGNPRQIQSSTLK